jgi:membrane associated rhomboid family serine protease
LVDAETGVKAACVLVIGAATVQSVLQVAPVPAGRQSMVRAVAADWRRPKPMTLLAFLITGGFAIAQRLHPALLRTLERHPDTWSNHHQWQYATQLLVQSPFWQTPINLLALLVIGASVERIFGAGRWLLCYLGGAAAGETAGVFWQPYGAGNSIAVLGLLGALFAYLMVHPDAGVGQGRVSRVLGLAGGAVLLYLHDIHGAGLWGGFLIGLLLTVTWRRLRGHPEDAGRDGLAPRRMNPA